LLARVVLTCESQRPAHAAGLLAVRERADAFLWRGHDACQGSCERMDLRSAERSTPCAPAWPVTSAACAAATRMLWPLFARMTLRCADVWACWRWSPTAWEDTAAARWRARWRWTPFAAAILPRCRARIACRPWNGRCSTRTARFARAGLADPSLEGMGTTATALVIVDNSVFFAHVGDSRLYHCAEWPLSATDRGPHPGPANGEERRAQRRRRSPLPDAQRPHALPGHLFGPADCHPEAALRRRSATPSCSARTACTLPSSR
jgi:hypothetical protein